MRDIGNIKVELYSNASNVGSSFIFFAVYCCCCCSWQCCQCFVAAPGAAFICPAAVQHAPQSTCLLFGCCSC